MEVKKSNKLTLFNPAFIDDYGFTAEEFRIFARIMRRAQGEKSEGCFESVPEMAEATGIGVNLVRQCLHVLEACGAITRTVRKGKTDLIDFNTSDKWQPSEKLGEIRNSFEANRKRKDRERLERHKNRVVTDNAGVTPHGKRRGVVTDNAGVLVTDNADEGTDSYESYPNEGNPIKGETPAAAQDAGKPKPSDNEQFHSLPTSLIPKEPSLPRAVEIYQEIYPTVLIDGDRLRMFCNKLPTVNESLWRQTLENWKLDGHKSGNLSGMIDRYEKELKRLPKMSNGFIQHDTKPKAKFLH